NPNMVVFGAQEHCDDIIGDSVLKLPTFKCVSVFKARADMGSIAKLPADTLPGVEITAVRQPHSGPSDGTLAPTLSGGDRSPQSVQAARTQGCTQLAGFPVDPS